MKKIAAVVVTYNNTEMLNNLLVDLHNQTRPLDEFIVIDNSITDTTKDMITDKFSDITYFRLTGNQGSAGGFHEGLKSALVNNDLIWTLDDDVRLNNDSLESLLIDLESLNHVKNIGVIRSGGTIDSEGLPNEMDMYTWRGTLFIADAVKQVGLPKKKYFIYGEDLEYSIRLKKNGFSLYWAPSSAIREVRDEKTKKNVFGINRKIYKDSFRFYYAFRNEIYIYTRHWYPVKLFKIFFYACKVLLYIIFFDKTNCFNKIYAITSGIFDGIRGRLGKNINFIPSKQPPTKSLALKQDSTF